MIPEPTCVLCGQATKTTEHLFMLCEWTKEIWADPKLNIDITPSNIAQMDKWVCAFLTSKNTMELKSFFGGVIWQIWKGCNALVFQNRKPNPRAILEDASFITQLSVRWNQK
ncbi:hypothetical protein BT93_H1916 [Corymbia citriodora subsp. variegata]|nr:hypothetical protein BT93_H1916 [Corymbia citriodora subsp. variegata]